MEKRVFLIVLDSFGIGAEPDAAAFGDEGTNTLAAVAQSPALRVPTMGGLGLFNIEGVNCGKKSAAPVGAFARLQEASNGKDTTIGHWEIAGVVSPKPLPTYPQGFPPEVLEAFEAAMEAQRERARAASLKSKTVEPDGIDLDFEVRLRGEDSALVSELAASEGVSNVALVSYNGD